MNEHEDEYDEDFVHGLEWMWGEGFLSPGGPEEVRVLLNDVTMTEKSVLDIGCGLGGIDLLLVTEHQASHVTGIDIEKPLIARAQSLVKAKGLEDRIDIQWVVPGPLPFDDGTFDVVFSKDSLIHVEDKLSLYRDVHRVLKPGGQFVFSDWLRGDGPDTPEWLNWLNIVGLSFNVFTLQQTLQTVSEAGFENVQGRDRNQWYQGEIQRELELASGDQYQKLVAAVGQAAAEKRVQVNRERRKCVDQGLLRPSHVIAYKS